MIKLIVISTEYINFKNILAIDVKYYEIFFSDILQTVSIRYEFNDFRLVS